MELNDFRSDDSTEQTSTEDERRLVNGNKNTFNTFVDHMR